MPGVAAVLAVALAACPAAGGGGGNFGPAARVISPSGVAPGCPPAVAIASKQSAVVVAARVATNGTCALVSRLSNTGGASFSPARVAVAGTGGAGGLVLLSERESGDFLLFVGDELGGRPSQQRTPEGSAWLRRTAMNFATRGSGWAPAAGGCQLASGLLVLGGQQGQRAAVAVSDDFGFTWQALAMPTAANIVGVVSLPAPAHSLQQCAGEVCPSGDRFAAATSDGGWFSGSHAGVDPAGRINASSGALMAMRRWGNSVFVVFQTGPRLEVSESADGGSTFRSIAAANTSAASAATAIALVPSVVPACNDSAAGCGFDAHALRPVLAWVDRQGVNVARALAETRTSCLGDCSHHGSCINETCLCEPGWAAPDCSTVRENAHPTDHNPATRLFQEGTSAANNATTIVVGHARFQLLTPSLVRMEWSPTGRFTDAPTLSVLRRSWPQVEHSVARGKTTVITTAELRIEFKTASTAFDAESVRVGAHNQTWRPGDIDAQNLGGFARGPHDMSSYDTLSHGLTNSSAQHGFLSRGAFTFIDDTSTPQYDASVDWIRPRAHMTAGMPNSTTCASISQRVDCAPELGLGRDSTRLDCDPSDPHCPNPPVDLNNVCASKNCCFDNRSLPMCFYSTQYRDGILVVHNGDHKASLRTLASLLGMPPMPPRHALGAWIGDRASYSVEQWKSFILRFRELSLPVDMLTIDSDGSTKATWVRGDWDMEMMPSPREFWQWLREHGVIATVNEHFSAITRETAHQFEAVRQRMGFPPTTDSITHTIANKSYAAAFWEELHAEALEQGMGFWWQDGAALATQPYVGPMPGLDPMLWTRHVEYEYHRAQADSGNAMRPWIFCRAGGVGGHRYGTVFTGDIGENWVVMRSTLIVSIRAGNALAPFLASNDMGLDAGTIGLDAVMYARWLQMASLMPHLWLHPSWGTRFPFDFQQSSVDMYRKFVGLRYRLMPYIYTYARLAHESGLPLVRGTFLEYPHADESYLPCQETTDPNSTASNQCQFMLGEHLLVAPVTEPPPANGSANQKTIWLPSGAEFYDLSAPPTVYRGGQTLTYHAPLDTLPHFAKAGAIVPMAPPMLSTSERVSVDPLIVSVFAGKGASSFAMYEDDGNTTEFARSQAFAWTRMKF
eukprot:COSAG04_NODE_2649_length_3796_cov_5.382743_1_plen_1130_part_10